VDIEPDLRDLEQWAKKPWRSLPGILRRSLDSRRFSHAQSAYLQLAKEIRADGYSLDSYQFPFINDERRIKSTLLRRATGLVDIPADREVWMLYSSFSKMLGVGYLWSYAPEAPAIGLGSTGGGVFTGIGDPCPLTWDEFSRDLRLAWYWNDDLHIYSLEGCIRQGFLERLEDFAWDYPILFPEEQAEVVNRWRGGLQSALWASRYLKITLISGLIAAWVAVRLRKLVRQKSR
jgi:hypothetical protein